MARDYWIVLSRDLKIGDRWLQIDKCLVVNSVE